MARYILRRLLLMIVVLFGMSVITFGLTHIVPGNPARLLAGQHATKAQVEAVAKLYGLDRPLLEQYWVYITGLFHGDLGMSLTTRRPVLQDVRQYLPATIELTSAAILLVIAIGLPTGMLAAIRRGQPLDHLVRFLTVAGVSMPIFWFGIVLQIVFYRNLQVLPIGGRLGIIDLEPPRVTGAYVIDSLLAGQFDTFVSALIHLILPAATLAAGSIAVVTRMM